MVRCTALPVLIHTLCLSVSRSSEQCVGEPLWQQACGYHGRPHVQYLHGGGFIQHHHHTPVLMYRDYRRYRNDSSLSRVLGYNVRFLKKKQNKTILHPFGCFNTLPMVENDSIAVKYTQITGKV